MSLELSLPPVGDQRKKKCKRCDHRVPDSQQPTGSQIIRICMGIITPSGVTNDYLKRVNLVWKLITMVPLLNLVLLQILVVGMGKGRYLSNPLPGSPLSLPSSHNSPISPLGSLVPAYCSPFLAPVVQKLDNAIHWKNLCPVDNAVGFCNHLLAG